MSMQESVIVALDLEVDPAEIGVAPLTEVLDRLGEHLGAGQERVSALAGEVGQAIYTWGVGDEDAVPRQELDVPDHREAGIQAREHRGILAAKGSSHAVLTPVGRGHGATVCPVQAGGVNSGCAFSQR